MPSKFESLGVSINAHFHFLVERVGISGGSLFMEICEYCFIYYRVTES